MKRRKIIFRRSFAVFIAALFFLLQLAPLASATDFDFYETQLLAKESYKRISMDFKEAELKDVLKIFSQQSGLNFVAADNVANKTLTLYLDDVPLQDALKKIMEANRLEYALDPGSNIFIVKDSGSPEMNLVTKVYTLSYARIKTSRLEQMIASGGEDEEDSSSSSTTAAETEGGIEESVQSILTANGRLIVDPRTNSIIVTDVASQFPVIDKLITSLDVPTPQVMIEVEMIDVSKQLADEIGVDVGEGAMMSLYGAARDTTWPFSVDSPSMQAAAGGTPMKFTYGKLDSSVFTAILQLLRTDTKSKFLARPRILTLSNETATIKITTDEAIGEKISTSSSEGTSTSSKEAERYETGVSLKVTPQVDLKNGSITMFVQPKVAVTRPGLFSDYRDPEVRTSVTSLRIKDGETIVIGGLLKTDETYIVKKMPILGDIPIIGLMFRHKSLDKEERELLVFITPHIVVGSGSEFAKEGPETNIKTTSGFSQREQSLAVLRKEEVDNMLQRWEN